MLLEIDGSSAIKKPTEQLIRNTLFLLRSYGPSSYATLSDSDGNYVQVAGGGQTCMIEWRDAESGKHFRGFKEKKSKIFSDGTVLSFSGGEIKLMSDEWFTKDEALELFLAFFRSKKFPDFMNWRDAPKLR